MIRLRDRNVFPPGGWQFFQAETGWKIAKPLEVSFSAAVKLIIAHRKANPSLPLATDYDSVANELEQRTLARLGAGSAFAVDLNPVMARTHVTSKRGCRSCG